jgi:hypothetical protein
VLQCGGAKHIRRLFIERMYYMAVEYSYIPSQIVAVDENILFMNGNRCCKKGLITHNDSSGVFRVKGVGGCKTIYKVHFNANVAVAPAADGGVLEPISVSLTQNGEVLRNAVATVTPAAIGDLWNVSLETFIELPCGCCDTITVRNISATTAIEVVNANLIIDRVA